MPATCSICADPEAASIINEMLHKKAGLDTIASATGFHRSSVHRHAKKCYPAWRAARLRDRTCKDDQPGLVFIQWPDDPSAPPSLRRCLTRNYGTTNVDAAQIAANDILFVVQYAKPLAERAKIPPAPATSPTDTPDAA